MQAPVPRYFSAASSDQGFVRPNNEDRVYCDESRGIFLVVDGMGGQEGGEEAAEIAIQRIRARLERQTDSVEQRVREAITLANNAIFQAAEERPLWKGMACVLTAAVIENGHVTVGHVGDSRLYRIRRGVIEKLTHDHSPVGEREDSGELTEAAAMQHPRRNEVYRDVGSEEHAPDDEGFIEVAEFPFATDQALLLCSDGLTDAVSSEQILSFVEQNVGDRWATVRALIAAATEVGHDNVSVILIEGEEFVQSFGQRSGRKKDLRLPADSMAGKQNNRTATFTAARWYRRGPAYMLYGALLGGLLTFAIGAFLLRQQAAQVGETLTVTAPGSIGDALRRAHAGDIIDVAPGIYPETVTLKEGVSVMARRANEAVIRGEVSAENLRSTRLEGFQVRGGGFGIRIKNSDAVIARDDIAGAHGAGVEFSGNSGGAIFGCTIHGNAGPGITLADAASPTIENNVILDNGKQPDAPRPGLFVRSSAKLVIAGNIFAGNGAEPIWLPAPDESIFQRNSFSLSGSHSGTADARPKIHIVPLGEGRP